MTTSVTPAAGTTITGAPRMTSLVRTAQALVASDKGLLAIDESIPTCNKRFARLGITQDKQTRRPYRELIVTTPGLGDSISRGEYTPIGIDGSRVTSTEPRQPTPGHPHFEQADAHHEH